MSRASSYLSDRIAKDALAIAELLQIIKQKRSGNRGVEKSLVSEKNQQKEMSVLEKKPFVK